MRTQEYQTLSLLWPKMFSGSFSEWKAQFEGFAKGRKLTTVFTPNPEQVMMAKKEREFSQILQTADWFLPDGIGIIFAQRWCKLFNPSLRSLKQKIGGRSVVEWWLKRGGPEKTLLIGAYGDTAERTAQRFNAQGEWLKGVVGLSSVANALSSSPSLKSQEELAQLRQLIQKWQPAVVFVAFGAPWQEMWVAQNKEFLQEVGVKVVMVCGGALDVLSGKVSAPPKVFEILALEWLWRLIQQPWRWKRQLQGSVFFWDLLRGRV